MKKWEFRVGAIPDPAEHRLAAVAGGDVRGQVFERSEHLLRMVGRFPAGTLTCCVRAFFDPKAQSLQDRLRWTLAVYSDSASAPAVASLAHNGPLGPFYRFDSVANNTTSQADGFSACTEILRDEEALRPLVPVELNARVPSFYYAVHPFVPNRGNDYQLLDRALSEIDSEVRLDILVEAADARPLRELHLEALSRLLAVNAYDDSTFIPGEEEALGRGEGFFSDDPPSYGGTSQNRRIKDPLADEFQREAQQLLENLRRPQMRFSIKVFAAAGETARAVAGVVAESCFADGRYQLLTYDSGSPWFNESRAAADEGRFFDEPADLAPFWGDEPPPKLQTLRGLARMATAEELAGAFRLPISGRSSPRCMRKSTDPKIESDADRRAILVGHDLEMGLEPDAIETKNLAEILDQPPPRVPHLRLPLDLLNKHTFVAGAPGSGKTTAVFNLLVQLHRCGVPFLVIEPAKTEYRVLKALQDHPDETVRDLATRLRVYTPGNEGLSPFRFNPLEYPDDEISRDEHIANLMACFKASFPMWGPLPAIIADAVEEAYRGLPDDRRWPTMLDVVEHAREIAAGKGYEGEVKSNIEASINVRLENLTRRSVGRIFSQEQCTPTAGELLSEPMIIELEHVDSETSCLLTLFLLSAMRQRIRMRGSGSELEHVIVIEEAHNIVGRTGEASAGEESVDPRAFAAQYISRMLAELRALGEGLVIADQLPSTVAPEVIKNTGIKLAGRLVSRDDREDLGATMLLGPVETEEIARLRVGEAYLYHEKLHGPRRVRALNSAAYLGINETTQPAGRAILEHLQHDRWFQEVLGLQIKDLERAYGELRSRLSYAGKEINLLENKVASAPQQDQVLIADIREEVSLIERDIQRRYELFFREAFNPMWRRVVEDERGTEEHRQALVTIDENLAFEVNSIVEGCMIALNELRESLEGES